MRKAMAWFMAAVAIVSFQGCSGEDPTTATTPEPAATQGPVRNERGVAGPLPERATSSDQVDPNFHSGQEVFITNEGFVPKQLVAKVDAEIWFVNETDDAQEIRFVNGSYRSGPIEAGEKATYTPDAAVSIVYALADDDERGAIQVEEYYEPGETAGPDEG